MVKVFRKGRWQEIGSPILSREEIEERNQIKEQQFRDKIQRQLTILIYLGSKEKYTSSFRIEKDNLGDYTAIVQIKNRHKCRVFKYNTTLERWIKKKIVSGTSETAVTHNVFL
jgi:hypothetical protein